MSNGAIVERYARAILELGEEAKQLALLTEQIRRRANAYASSNELQSILHNPVVTEAKREAILTELADKLGLPETAKNAIRLLARRQRLEFLPAIALRLQGLADEKAGVLRATVTTAKKMSPSFYTKLSAELEKSTSRKIILEKKEDSSLIAGAITRIGDHIIDGSLKGRLQELERQLLSAP